MADTIKVEMSAEEWGQVMMVLQGGIYRVVAPLLQRINNQVVSQAQLRVVKDNSEDAPAA
jgi:hypothetical protein